MFDAFSDLRTTRARLLEMFTDVTCNPEIMKNATDAYFSLLQGMFTLVNIDLFFYMSLINMQWSVITKRKLLSQTLFKPIELYLPSCRDPNGFQGTMLIRLNYKEGIWA